MGSDRVQDHLLALLDRIIDVGHRAEKEGLPDCSLMLTFLPASTDVAVAVRELRQLGLHSAAESLDEQAQALQNAILDLGLTDWVTAGEDYERLRERFGVIPQPHPDPVRHNEIQADRRLVIGGRLSRLVRSVEVLRKSLASEDPLQGGGMAPTSYRDAGTAPADGKADGKKKSGAVVPENPDVVRLAKKINRELFKGGTKVDIARDFTNGDEKKAQSLLRKLRDFPHLLR